MAPSVLIGVSTSEYARRADFYDYLSLLERPANSFELKNHDRSPAAGRNGIIEQAKQQECSHVLFIDDDMTFKNDALIKLLRHDVDIVSGLYLGRAFPHSPLVFDLADEADGKCLPCYLDEDTKPLIPIVAAGFGFLLVKMSVFDKLEKPYVRLGELDPQEWCDDIGFFNRVRKAGIQSYCDTEVCCGHIGTMIIWPNKLDGQWFAGYDTTGIGLVAGMERQMVNVPQSLPHYAAENEG